MSYQNNQYQQQSGQSGSSRAGGAGGFNIATDYDYESYNNDQHQPLTTPKNQVGGLGTEILKIMKKASHDKKASAGKRKPLGNVHNGRKILEARAADKKELQKVHKIVQKHEMC